MPAVARLSWGLSLGGGPGGHRGCCGCREGCGLCQGSVHGRVRLHRAVLRTLAQGHVAPPSQSPDISVSSCNPLPGLRPRQSQRGADVGPAAHSLHLRDRDPDRLPGRGGSHPLHVGSMLCPPAPSRAADGPVTPRPGQAGGTCGSLILGGGMPLPPQLLPRKRGAPQEAQGHSLAGVVPWLLSGPSFLVRWRGTLQRWPPRGWEMWWGPAAALV